MEDAWAWAQAGWMNVTHLVEGVWVTVAPRMTAAADFLSNPAVRAIALLVIVYLTIRVIASVYSGDRQNSELGPVGIRPHAAQRLDRRTIVLPRRLMPMNMDGVSATLTVYYAYTDSRGRPCKQLIHVIPHCRLVISPSNLPRVVSTIYGHEVPDVETADVCFPAAELETTPNEMPATPDRARSYAELHKIVENWREDDDALLISLHSEQHEEGTRPAKAVLRDEVRQRGSPAATSLARRS